VRETHTIQVQMPDREIGALAVEVFEDPSCKLVVRGLGLISREFHGEDLFEALIGLRIALERMGCRLLCAGARADVYPSGMARDLGSARKAYILRIGFPGVDLIDIFTSAAPELIGTVEEQQKFYDKWMQNFHNGRAT